MLDDLWRYALRVGIITMIVAIIVRVALIYWLVAPIIGTGSSNVNSNALASLVDIITLYAAMPVGAILVAIGLVGWWAKRWLSDAAAEEEQKTGTN
jgi:hypothetical protein